MDNSPGMRSGKRTCDLRSVFERLFQRQLAAQQSRRQGFAFHKLHHQVGRAYIVQRADMGVIQRGDGAGFALEALS